MKGFTQEDLDAAEREGVLDAAAADRLRAFVRLRAQARADASPGPRFDAVHALWYAGALVVIGAMSIFATQAFARLGGPGVTGVALAYGAGFLWFGDRLWRRGLRTPGGLAVSVAAAMAPLAVYGLLETFGLWRGDGRSIDSDLLPFVVNRRVLVEAAAVLASLLALRVYPFPFLTAVASAALWLMSQDPGPSLGYAGDTSYDARSLVSMIFGLALAALAWAVDLRRPKLGESRSPPDFGFWPHLAAAAAFWGGLTLRESTPGFESARFLAINVALIVFSIFIRRRVYAVFGAVGVCVYLGHLAYGAFRDSAAFPFALSAVGLMVMALGLALRVWLPVIDRAVDRLTPTALRALRPPP